MIALRQSEIPVPAVDVAARSKQRILEGLLLLVAVASGVGAFSLLRQALLPQEVAAVAGIFVGAGAAMRITKIVLARDEAVNDAPAGGSTNGVAVVISRVASVREVVGLKAAGPGYLIRTLDGEAVLAISPQFGFPDNRGRALGEKVVLYVTPDFRKIVRSEWQGEPVKVAGATEVGSLGIGETVCFRIVE